MNTIHQVVLVSLMSFGAGCAEDSVYGVYEARVAVMQFSSSTPDGDDCVRPLTIFASDADLVLESPGVLVFQGCRLSGKVSGHVFAATRASCEPAESNLSFLARRIYERVNFDTESGVLSARTSSLGADGEGRCSRVDGIAKKRDEKVPGGVRLTEFVGPSESTSPSLQVRFIGEASAYFVEEQDGSVSVMGLGCVLPSSTDEAGSALEASACSSGFEGQHGVPEFFPTRYVLTDERFEISGEFRSEDITSEYEASGERSPEPGW